MATTAKASALSLQSLGMCSSFQSIKFFKRCFTQDTYFTIRGSRDSNSSLTCPTTNWESLRTRSLSANRVAASSRLTRITSYSDSLLEELNPSWIACSILSPDWDLNYKPMPAPVCLDAPCQCKVSTDPSCPGVLPIGGVLL